MIDETKLKHVVRTVLEERFDDVRIEAVEIEPDLDEYSDEILRTKVVFDDTPLRLDPLKTSGLVRHMRPKLADIGEEAFPVFSFISKSDWQTPSGASRRPHQDR